MKPKAKENGYETLGRIIQCHAFYCILILTVNVFSMGPDGVFLFEKLGRENGYHSETGFTLEAEVCAGKRVLLCGKEWPVEWGLACAYLSSF
jgi:hypothetical protein